MSELLKKLCKQILVDEDQHIAFQAYTLSILNARKGWIRRFLSRAWNQVLMTGTIFVVWSQHLKIYSHCKMQVGFTFEEHIHFPGCIKAQEVA